MSAHEGNRPAWSVGDRLHDSLLDEVVVVSVNPKVEPHWDYLVRREVDGPYGSTFVTSESMLSPRASLEEAVRFVLDAWQRLDDWAYWGTVNVDARDALPAFLHSAMSRLASAAEDHGPGCDGPYNCVCSDVPA